MICIRFALVLAFFSLLSAQAAPSASIFPRGSEWKLFKGRSEASAPDAAAWREASFDDAAWDAGRAPFYFGEALSGTILSDMLGNYSSVFLRKKFTVANPQDFAALELGAVIDDGFVAWINGREVARENVGIASPVFNSLASGTLPEPVPFKTYAIPGAAELLVPGENIITVLGLNASLSGSSDFWFDASLTGIPDDSAPLVEAVFPPDGSLLRQFESLEARFTKPVQGVEAADLLINGAPAESVQEFAPGDFVFSFPQPANGTVTVAWRANHGITDRATLPHPFAGGSWTFHVDASGVASNLILSEFLASNDDVLHDEDGDNSDWIEIFNPGPETASLKDWFLTDDTNNLSKWRFPDVAIPANGFLVVFASEKNRTIPTGKLHTNFKLSTEGEHLALVSPATNVISQFAPFPAQFENVSYGRAQGFPLSAGYFSRPTPGSRNADSGQGFAPLVEFSRAGGPVTEPFDLALSTRSANAVIRYTLDGSLPAITSPAYTGSIRIATGMQVRARAFQDGLLPGPPRTEAYLYLSNNLVNFTSDLPVIVIHTMGKGSPTASRLSFAHYSVFEPVNGVTSLTNAPALRTRGGIKLRGSSTEGLAKSSFAVEFWDEFDLDFDQEILGLPSESDWVLYAPNQFDPVMIHNPFLHQLSRDTGMYSSRTRFVEVYLVKTAGVVAATHYNGIYVLEEKIKINKNRVDIDKLEPEHVRTPEVTGGYLMKIDRLDPGDGGLNIGGARIGYVDPKEPEIEVPQRDPQEQYIRSYMADFNRSLTAANWQDPVNGYAAYIDVDNWVDFHVLEVLSGNVDTLVLSTYFHKPRNGKLRFGPHWDFDRALGSTDGRDQNPRNWSTGPFFSAPWWSRVLRDPNFWQKWIDRYQEWRESHLSLTNIHRLIDDLSNEVRLAHPRERQKWRTPLRGGSYQGEVSHMKNWLSNRIDFIDRQLAQPPVFSAPGGAISPGFMLTLSAPPNTTILFTRDGTDPRASGGGISAAAETYTGPIRLDTNTRIMARGRNTVVRQSGGPPISSPWSRAVAHTYLTALADLRVTEFMFHPAPPPAGSSYMASDFEYIELMNTGSGVLPLSGYRLGGGIDYAFGTQSAITSLRPGERIVLVKNRAAFLSRYPAVSNIAGEFIGALSDQGDRITLINPKGEVAADIPYDDAWNRLADGLGFSLTAIDAANPFEMGSPSAWRPSSIEGGTPGAADSGSVFPTPVLVNEVEAYADNSDRVELHNPNSVPVSLAGWFLTDDLDEPRKLKLGAITVPPAGYVVLDDAVLSASATTTVGFSRYGDGVYLLSADAGGRLTGHLHGFDFDASERNQSFGRHVNSAGEESFVPQSERTFGRANAAPLLPSIVISEIAPFAPGMEPCLEVRNISSAAVPLFDPARPANTWSLQGSVEFTFPPGAALAPGAVAVIVGFNPQQDTARAAAFRARHSIPADVPVMGPWNGSLAASGVIRLLKPLEPEPQAAAPSYALAERVAYSAAGAWPANENPAALTLNRRGPAAFGDDPASWHLSWANPGDVDADRDGLPDRWELAHGLSPAASTGQDGRNGDPDGDGFLNFEELRAGSGPRDAAEYVRLSAAASPQGVAFSLTAVPGRVFLLEVRDSLASGQWQLLRQIVPQAAGAAVVHTEGPSQSSRFYRISAP